MHEDNCYHCACFKIFTFLSYHLIFKLFSENENSSFFWKSPIYIFVCMKVSIASCSSIILFSILAENLYLINFAEYIQCSTKLVVMFRCSLSYKTQIFAHLWSLQIIILFKILKLNIFINCIKYFCSWNNCNSRTTKVKHIKMYIDPQITIPNNLKAREWTGGIHLKTIHKFITPFVVQLPTELCLVSSQTLLSMSLGKVVPWWASRSRGFALEAS